MKILSTLTIMGCAVALNAEVKWSRVDSVANAPAVGVVGICESPVLSRYIATWASATSSFQPLYSIFIPGPGWGSSLSIFSNTSQGSNGTVLTCAGNNGTNKVDLITFSDPGNGNLPSYTVYNGSSFSPSDSANAIPNSLAANPLSPIYAAFDSSTGFTLSWLGDDGYPYQTNSSDLVSWLTPSILEGAGAVTTPWSPFVYNVSDTSGHSFFTLRESDLTQPAYTFGLVPDRLVSPIPNSAGNAGIAVFPTYDLHLRTFIVTWVDQTSSLPTYTIVTNKFSNQWTDPAPIPGVKVKANPNYPIVSAYRGDDILFVWLGTDTNIHYALYNSTSPSSTATNRVAADSHAAPSSFKEVGVIPNTTGATSGPYVASTSDLVSTFITAFGGPDGLPTSAIGKVSAVAATTTTVTSSPNPSSLCSKVTIKAKVASASGIPAGTVVFQSNGKRLGTAELNSKGVATIFKCTLPRGSNNIRAVYKGNANFLPSSGTTVQMVN